ncbi:hypothetical protein AQ1_00048 [alpha proteobacterium Q-1]|nr:hypothetical protein AQ1_00048 [alpha proteobacterium Q-1]
MTTDQGAGGILIRRHDRARRLGLRIDRRRALAVCTAPMGASARQIDQFISHHQGWIKAQLDRLPQRLRFIPGSFVPLYDVPHLIQHGDHLPRAPQIIEGAIHVGGPPDRLEDRILRWLRAMAQDHLATQARQHASRLDVELGRVRVRDTISRWGSCTAAGDLSFNWRLVLAPPLIGDYVAAHEVAHRLHMDHSPHFWAVVDRLVPHRHEARLWLRQNGEALMRMGPPPG